MLYAKVVIHSLTGLHARPIIDIVESANRFKSSIHFKKNDLRVNAKSILGVLGLEVFRSDEITVSADGEDESEALDKILSILKADIL